MCRTYLCYNNCFKSMGTIKEVYFFSSPDFRILKGTNLEAPEK